MFFIYNNFTISIYGSFCIIDYNTRFNANDALISSFYIMWTSQHYLITFFYSVFFLYLYTTYTLYTVISGFYILLIGCLYLANIVEFFDFIAFNECLKTLVSPDIVINILLINMLNRYHPFIFYLSTLCIISWLFVVNILKIKKTKYVSLNFKNNTMIFYSISTTVFITTAIYLGAWWADQEGSWGGWWASDSSEMLGLLVFVLPLLITHSSTISYNYSKHLYILILIFLLITILYYFLQINYELVSHNFGSKFFFFYNNNLWAIFCILMSTVLLLKMSNVNHYLELIVIGCSYKKYLNSFKFITSVKYVYVFFLLFWFFFSSLPLIDSFILNYKHEQDNVLEELYSFTRTCVLVYTTLLLFNELRLTRLSAAVLTYYNISNLPMLFLYSFNYKSVVKTLHWLLICFIGINLYTNSLMYMYYNHFDVTVTFFTNNNFYSIVDTLYVCDNCWFHQSTLLLNKASQVFNVETLLSYFNSFEYDKNLCIFNNNIMFNCLFISTNYNPLYIFIEHAEEMILNIIFFFIIVVSIRQQLRITHCLFY